MSAPGFIVAQISVISYSRYFTEYGRPLRELVHKYGGRILVASNRPGVLEGNWHGNWTVIIQFPSMKQARLCYESPDYAPLRECRINHLSSDGNVVLFEGVDPG